ALGRVIGNLAAGVVILQDDRIAYVNGRAARMLGREVAALVGTDPASLLSGDERGRPGETLAAIIQGRIEEDYTEHRLVLPDGRSAPHSSNCAATSWPIGEPSMPATGSSPSTSCRRRWCWPPASRCAMRWWG